ncbi:TMAO reductase system periplasmic protein TorT [Aeromonas bivalvium]|uniref:TMAO reductase system periplasmic protein TorT n=1 Tax=Aeromonas bivalvium TaxID=440079 RepID=UPI0038D2420A
MRSLILCLLLTLPAVCARAAFTIQPWPETADPLQLPPPLSWTGPVRAERPFELCALYPHLRDAYWLSVNQGMVEEASRLGIGLRVHEAGGYGASSEQARQLAACAREGSDAILLGAVDGPALAEAIGKSPLPVFGLVNALPPAHVVAQVGVPWYQMGWRIGHWLALRHPAGSPPVRVALLPGPEGRGGNSVVEPGFSAAIAGSAITLVDTLRGDNSREIQRSLVQQLLTRHPHLDYLVGGAMAAEVAVNELARRGDQGAGQGPAVLAIYFSHGVQRALLRGRLALANSDQMREQGRLAVAQAVCLLQRPDASEAQCPRRMGPAILTLSGPLAASGDTLSDPAFRPVYRLAPGAPPPRQ